MPSPCCVSSDPKKRELLERSRAQRKEDKDIQRQLKRDEKRRKKSHRVLLLGTGGGGKTTFLNQMKIILNGENAFTEEERQKFRKAIMMNIYDGIKTLLHQMEVLNIKYETDPKIVASIRALSFDECLNQDKNNFQQGYALKVQKLWQDKGVQKCFARRSEFILQDSVKYFLDRLDEIVAPEYLPKNEDILHTRVKTEKAYHHIFYPSEDRNMSMVLIDVGGQRELRKQWLPLFDDVTSIIFITSLSEFDQTLEEDESTNRTEESILLFKSILKLRSFMEIPIILFLNKKDLLESKLRDVNFNDYFPSYDPTDEELIKEAEKPYLSGERMEAVFLRQLYMQQREEAAEEQEAMGIPRSRKERQIYAHITQATHRENITKIWNSIKAIVLSTALTNMNL